MSETRVVIDPVSRVEGHGKVTLLVNDAGIVTQARLHIVEFRGFEKFIQGRPYWELPMVVQRLCGICPVSHHLVAAKAIDQIVGVTALSAPALKLRRLMHFAQVLQSHALHFFHLASPDLLFGFQSPVEQRNIVAVIKQQPQIAIKGVKIRKFGQQILEAISGKRIHGMAAIPGGMNAPLTPEKIQPFKQDVQQIIDWCEETVKLSRQLTDQNRDFHLQFGLIESPFMGLVGKNGELELYDGNLRVIDARGNILQDQFPCDQYPQLIQEQVKSWSYMKFPFLTQLGSEQGWYRVGPLARINLCDFIPTPRAEQARQQFRQYAGAPAHSPLLFHWARMIEALHCAEAIADLLADPDLLSTDLQRSGIKQKEGIGVIEAPRGTLFHHYQIDAEDRVTMANLIVSTTSNNQAMNDTIRKVAQQHLDGQTLTPELLNLVEVAIRAYDPCLSCATHAVGKMPLQLLLQTESGNSLDQLTRHTDGHISR
ncbi:MAG: Ni/Fe hydrogenase subunit alpha [Gammaproteobacteria bacterium]|nr:Ni/Fe hydrogenase subunit alpha [Gammaproteobacteria bacterium]